MLYLVIHEPSFGKAYDLKEQITKRKVLNREPELYMKKRKNNHKYLKTTWIVAAVLERGSNGV